MQNGKHQPSTALVGDAGAIFPGTKKSSGLKEKYRTFNVR